MRTRKSECGTRGDGSMMRGWIDLDAGGEADGEEGVEVR